MRRGSLEFWPHRRAKKLMPRVRHWPASTAAVPLGIVGFKAGMTHIMHVDTTESPSKGTEVMAPVTVIEVPNIVVYGIRFYSTDDYSYEKPILEVFDKQSAANVGIKNPKHTSLDDASKAEFSDLTLLAYVNPEGVGFGIKKRLRFEIPLGGKKEEKLEVAKKLLGKEVKLADAFKPGEYVDVTGITKGKGWQGPIKRFGVSRQFHKATGKVRHVGTLGPWHPPKVLYSVPMAGHMGHNYRTELNKRIMKIGSANEAKNISVAGGFPHYGEVRHDFMLVYGSVPGTPGMLLRIRKALRPTKPVSEPKITYVSTSSKIGA